MLYAVAMGQIIKMVACCTPGLGTRFVLFANIYLLIRLMVSIFDSLLPTSNVLL